MERKIVYTKGPKVFRVGDIITTYYKGYHRVLSYENRLLKFEAVMSEKMTKTAKVVRECDPHWCAVADREQLIEQLKKSIELVDSIFGGM